MKTYQFDEIQDRYQTGSYKYDRILNSYPHANKNTIIMTLADMDFKTAPEIIDYFVKTSKMGIFGYMTEFFDPYQEAIISWWKYNYQLTIQKEEIIFSNGTIEALKALINIFTQKGDYIALSRPVYGHFTSAIEEECDREVKDIHLINQQGYYEMNFPLLEKELSNPRCKMYVLCSPQNPTGRVWKKEELQTLIDICHRTNTLLVSDEVHCDLVRKNIKHYPILSIGDNHSQIVMLTAPGKTFNLSGLQCSNMIVKDENLRTIIRQHFDRDISTFAQAGCISAYSLGQDWKDALISYLDTTIEEAIQYIHEFMPYCEVYKPEGTYFLWLNFEKTKLSSEEIHHLIYEKANVILQDGTNHDPKEGKYFQRMPLGYPRKVIMEALKRIKEAFGSKEK